MADRGAANLPLRRPAEIPMLILMVVLNFAILAVLIDFLATTALIPPALRGTNWEATIRVVAAAIVLVAPAILLVRQVQRASIRGTAVQLSRTQFPDLYASVDDFAGTLRVKPTPTGFLSNGNGTLNAFAAQSGWTNNYVVLSNELFANLHNDNRDGSPLGIVQRIIGLGLQVIQLNLLASRPAPGRDHPGQGDDTGRWPEQAREAVSDRGGDRRRRGHASLPIG